MLSAAGPEGLPSRRAAELVWSMRLRSGQKVSAVAVRPSDLQRGGVRDALLAQGMDRLPALKPSSGAPVVGLAAIARWVAESSAAGPKPGANAGEGEGVDPADSDAVASEALEEYMLAQIRGGSRAEELELSSMEL